MAPVAGGGFRSILMITLVGGIFSILGAGFIGSRVESTIGNEIIIGNVSPPESLIIMFSIAAWTTFASSKGWPTSTTHSTIGATMGLGLIKFGIMGIQWGKITQIMLAWVLTPVIGLSISYFLAVYIRRLYKKHVNGLRGIVITSKRSAFTLFVLACILSLLSAGNDAGNATAFISNSIGVDSFYLRGFVGLGMALGLIMLGRKVLLTVGRDLVELTPVSGLSSLLSTSLIMLVANYYGIPLSNSHILVSSVIGTGVANKKYINVEKLLKILGAWVFTFIATGFLCLTCYQIMLYVFN
jgi:PiT family inorganic phosphate transporter